jgi:hypothetical protein
VIAVRASRRLVACAMLTVRDRAENTGIPSGEEGRVLRSPRGLLCCDLVRHGGPAFREAGQECASD